MNPLAPSGTRQEFRWRWLGTAAEILSEFRYGKNWYEILGVFRYEKTFLDLRGKT